jgi:hypothetical protein
MRDPFRSAIEMRPRFLGPAPKEFPPRDGAGEVAYYSLEVRLGAPLVPAAECDFADLYRGEILAHDEQSRPSTAGRFRASVFRVEEAAARDFSPADVWAQSRAMVSVYRTLFDRSTGRFREEIRERFRPANRDVLVLDAIELLPEHRGRDIGLAIALQLIRLLGRGCGLVACRPDPLQSSAGLVDGGEWRAEPDPGAGWDGPMPSVGRLFRHAGRIGFEEVEGGRGLLALSPSRARPTAEQLCPGLF